MIDHIIDDNNKERSQKNDLKFKKLTSIIKFIFDNDMNDIITYADIKIIIRIGSFATNKQNIANGGPNAINVQPKNSNKVIVKLNSD